MERVRVISGDYSKGWGGASKVDFNLRNGLQVKNIPFVSIDSIRYIDRGESLPKIFNDIKDGYHVFIMFEDGKSVELKLEKTTLINVLKLSNKELPNVDLSFSETETKTIKKRNTRNIVIKIISALIIVLACIFILHDCSKKSSKNNAAVVENDPTVMASDALEIMDKKSAPKAYKAWGNDGLEKINALAPKAAALVRKSNNCEKITIVTLSSNRSVPKEKIVFFVDCANGNRYYISQDDIKANVLPDGMQEQQKVVDDNYENYVTKCESLLKPKLQFPSSYDREGGRALLNGFGIVEITVPFNTKNGFGNEIPMQAYCLDNGETIELKSITPR